MSAQRCDRGGFTLVELGVIVAVLVSLGAAMIPGVQGMRGSSMDAQSRMNLHSIGQVSAMYASDHGGRVFSFSWQGGGVYPNPKNGTPRRANNDQQAAAWQVEEYLLRQYPLAEYGSWFRAAERRLMHRRYSHLVLADYMGLAGAGTQSPVFVDPADANQIAWRADPLGWLDDPMLLQVLPYGNGFAPGYDEDSNWDDPFVIRLWPFASSYQVVPAAWQPDLAENYYYPIAETPHLFQDAGDGDEIVLGERSYFEVRFPQGKVHMFEEFDREQAGSPYFAYDHAQVAKLMFDGSVNGFASGDAAPSFSPFDVAQGRFLKNVPEWRQAYVPLDTFPVPLSGLGENVPLSQRWRWTGYGLRGVDYPVPTRGVGSFGRR